MKKETNPQEGTQPNDTSVFFFMLQHFANTFDQQFPDHKLLVIASEPPAGDQEVNVFCHMPEEIHITAQMIAGCMASNPKVIFSVMGGVSVFLSEALGKEEAEKFRGYINELVKKHGTCYQWTKEMSPDADSE